MTDTEDLVAFLRARLDEDKRAARAAAEAAGPVWVAAEEEFGTFHPMGLDEKVWQWAYDSEEKATHIARHDPARVLREVEAKRRILDLVSPLAARFGDGGSSPGRVLHALALPYSDHPDYNPEWSA